MFTRELILAFALGILFTSELSEVFDLFVAQSKYR